MDFGYVCMHIEHTLVRWASEPNAIVEYLSIVDIAAVVAADGVRLTGGDKRRISGSQQIIFTDKIQRLVIKNLKPHSMITIVGRTYMFCLCRFTSRTVFQHSQRSLSGWGVRLS